MNFDRNSRKTFKILQNSGIPQEFESAELGILDKLLLSFLEMLKFLDVQFSVVHKGGGCIFSGIAQCRKIKLSDSELDQTNCSLTNDHLVDV